ncbi:hypothetical protein [Niallia sp. Krafla_26]|uniref:hypothetical protein n=1 Tax=Niallia sp. Krafla_26 TaxID=3064703 RepID=UPI003D1780AF
MESTREEKTMRLHDLLQDALKPMIEKIETLEEELKVLREGQEKILKRLAEKTES